MLLRCPRASGPGAAPVGAARPLRACAAATVAGATLLACASSAFGWGCDGHQIVALLAARHLTPAARSAAERLLAANPVGRGRERFCGNGEREPLADASTWADDVKDDRPETRPWHFIDVPLGARRAELRRACGRRGCLLSALDEQVRLLRRGGAGRTEAEALRFVVHFLADLHQPLHAATNGDEGGNCLPVDDFGNRPRKVRGGDYRPNLHAVWDGALLRREMRGRGVGAFADDLDRRLRVSIASWVAAPIDVEGWVWETHRAAEDVAYGKLATPVPVADRRRPRPRCDGGRLSRRLLRLRERIDGAYQAAAAPVVDEQLAKAGARLAALLNDLWR